jgi:hypothetical protein
MDKNPNLKKILKDSLEFANRKDRPQGTKPVDTFILYLLAEIKNTDIFDKELLQLTREAENLIFGFYLEDTKTLRSQLEVYKKEYADTLDEINKLKADGSLSRLCNLRATFDETFDTFFDDEAIARKYNDWNSHSTLLITQHSTTDKVKHNK